MPPHPAAAAIAGAAEAHHRARHGQGQADVDELFPGANAAAAQLAAEARRKEEEKKDKTLFGPPVGSVGGEERRKWGVSGEEREEVDKDVVKGWVDRSSESSTPTTTLQALTNLKRPSIRLSPLHPPSDASGPDPLAPHILEFSYDADAPLVSISIRVLPPTNQAGEYAGVGLKPEGEEVFLTVAKGGFGQALTAESNALIELGRYEALAPGSPVRLSSPTKALSPTAGSPVGSQLALASRVDGSAAPAPGTPGGRRRFSFLPTRHRQSTTHIMAPAPRTRGPAVPVVDNTAQPPRQDPIISPALAAQLGFQVVDRQEQEREKQRELEREEEERSGVRIGVWLEALDANGKKLPTRNAQATVLHVHRVGPKASSLPAGSPEGDLESGTAPPRLSINADGHAVDTRPWLVRVVHREAIIGRHAFTLHEIYGLASGTSDPHPQPAIAPPPQAHSYPPTAAAPPIDTASHAPECILCLSSPRSVVLMPCRHLVACKECALNMLEFGAGGTIQQPVEDGTDGAPGEPSGAAAGNDTGVVAGLAGLASGRTERRRKRKVKGWFCPICRQAYTSMLRISAAAPAGELVAEIEDETEPKDADHAHAQRASTSTVPAGWKVHEEGSPASRSAANSPAPEEREAPPAEPSSLHQHEHKHEHEAPAGRETSRAPEEEFTTAPATPAPADPLEVEERARA
ncbi:hypothetical protein CALCODRAFT_515044 [Calocera cornea HHB12733]|uniref:RING-type domain-containing protein n=1 Tax=Calocera cornea HHB12733 TaxID=1353952 RepID=A0A165IS76_9BASI|nr:hypothetical protein CALCODRAFT_515044 [Calocera cornea HHB12733]